MQQSPSVASMASTVSVPMEEVFGDWGAGVDSTGEAPIHPHHAPPVPTYESWEAVPVNTGYTMDTELGTQQYMNPPLHPSPFDTVRSMDVDETGPPVSPPPSPPHAPTEVPEGEQADYD
eukprot:3015740-Amphidinium_carterae.2